LPSFLINDARVSSTVTFLPANETTACSAKTEVVQAVNKAAITIFS
jgi:hypothetical protein